MSNQETPESIAVSKVPLFKDLEYADLISLLFFVQTKSVSQDSNLFHQHDQPDGMYILMAGALKIYLPPTSIGGKHKDLTELLPGQYVGEFGLIDGEPRSASVIAVKDSQVLFLPTTAFVKAIDEHPKIAKSVTNALCNLILSLPKLKIDSDRGLALIEERKVKPSLENMRRLTTIIRKYNQMQSQRI
jgi:CRP-like cAMP-binding protein